MEASSASLAGLSELRNDAAAPVPLESLQSVEEVREKEEEGQGRQEQAEEDGLDSSLASGFRVECPSLLESSGA